MTTASQKPKKWSNMQEKRTYLGLKTLLLIYKVLGVHALNFLLCFVVGVYFILGRTARHASQKYLKKLHVFMKEDSPWQQSPTLWDSFQHFMMFGRAAADKIIVWFGHYKPEDITFHGYEAYQEAKSKGRGVFFIASHIGTVDICRAIGGGVKKLPLTILAHNGHAPNFHRVMTEVTGSQSTIEVIEVQNMTPDIAIRLKAKIENGENIIITGDRIPVDSDFRYEMVPFLGEKAPFAQGPFILAGLLECPVFVLFAMKHGKDYHMFFEHFADTLKAPRAVRAEYLKKYIEKYVKILERYSCDYPLQWFNFYDYWFSSDGKDKEKH